MRPKCSSCERPLRVCLCAELPPQPIHTATTVLILQHPHETRHKLATVPIVARCLSNVGVIVGRRLQLGTCPLLDALSIPSPSSPPPSPSPPPPPPPVHGSGWRCSSCGRRKSVLLLFPTPSATELRTWMSLRVDQAVNDAQLDGCHGGGVAGKLGERSEPVEGNCGVDDGQLGLGLESGGCSGVWSADRKSEHIILLIVDGTWQHAREMVKASMPFLGGFVEQVCLPHDMTREGWGMGDSSSIVRKEPFAGCVSTMEAIARTLGMLEPDGVRIEQTLLAVLRQMVHLQAAQFAPLKPRPRLRKERPVIHTTNPS